LKILILNYEFPPIGGGGGKVAEQIAACLAQRGHEVKVHTSWLAGLPRRTQQDGYSLIRSFAFRRKPDRCTVPEMAGYVLASCFSALILCAKWKPDVIHAHFAVPTGAVAWWLNKLLGIPYMLTTHLGDVPGGFPQQTDRIFRKIKPLTNPIWRSAAAITAVSDHVRELSGKAYQIPVVTVHNGIDLSARPDQPPPLHEPRRFIFAGRFNKQKNLDFLIRAFGKVDGPDWRLDLLGNGPEMERLVALVERLGLAGRITFHGWVTTQRVDEFMRNSDILLIPSIMEGLPMVGLNALANGLVIIGSDTGGVRDIVRQGENGWLGPVNDLDGLVALLNKALRATPEEMMAMKAASHALAESFALEGIADKYEQILIRSARKP